MIIILFEKKYNNKMFIEIKFVRNAKFTPNSGFANVSNFDQMVIHQTQIGSLG